MSALPMSAFPINAFPMSAFPINAFPINAFPINAFPMSALLVVIAWSVVPVCSSTSPGVPMQAARVSEATARSGIASFITLSTQ